MSGSLRYCYGNSVFTFVRVLQAFSFPDMKKYRKRKWERENFCSYPAETFLKPAVYNNHKRLQTRHSS